MLKLTRHIGEAITITTPDGYTVEVKVLLPFKDGSTRLAFDAPREVQILRNELKVNTM